MFLQDFSTSQEMYMGIKMTRIKQPNISTLSQIFYLNIRFAEHMTLDKISADTQGYMYMRCSEKKTSYKPSEAHMYMKIE